MESLITLVLVLIFLYANFKILDEYSKSYALIVNVIVFAIMIIVSNLSGLTFLTLLANILRAIINAFVYTYIFSWAYNGAHTFIGYLLRIILVDIIFSLIVGAISAILGIAGLATFFSIIM